MTGSGADTCLKIGALVSGNGTNLQAIIDGCEQGQIDADVVLVICNRPEAPALKRAQAHGIQTLCVLPGDFPSREQYDLHLVEQLQKAGVGLIVLAGYMRLITDGFLQAFPLRIMNIHPSLLPAFPGLQVHQQAIDYGVRFSGCTVHFVDAGLDSGPIILQAVVPVHTDDTAESLSQRILEQEHRIYPQAVQLFAQGALEVHGRTVHVKKDFQPPLSMEG